MQPSIWTGMYCELPLAEALSVLHECGWSEVEISTEHLDRIETSATADEEVASALEAARGLGVAMTQAHLHLAADVAHPDAAQRRDLCCSPACGPVVGHRSGIQHGHP